MLSTGPAMSCFINIQVIDYITLYILKVLKDLVSGARDDDHIWQMIIRMFIICVSRTQERAPYILCKMQKISLLHKVIYRVNVFSKVQRYFYKNRKIGLKIPMESRRK